MSTLLSFKASSSAIKRRSITQKNTTRRPGERENVSITNCSVKPMRLTKADGRAGRNIGGGGVRSASAVERVRRLEVGHSGAHHLVHLEQVARDVLAGLEAAPLHAHVVPDALKKEKKLSL